MSRSEPRTREDVEQKHTRRAFLSSAGATAAVCVLYTATVGVPPAAAGLGSYNISGKDTVEVEVQMGGPNNELAFTPSTIELTAGRLTKLKLTNPSQLTHYFTALEFADKVYTVLVLAGDPAVEIKGKVQEVALKAGASATWVLVPIKPGTYPLRCSVKGHTEGGMVGSIVVRPAA
ncbi:hypothetical protein FOA52_012929 [Chlamydomonas sp. UWO 241]|nr:hypothetical protein FOA52_012929 [Chlamydomonas sp. UWO 241]